MIREVGAKQNRMLRARAGDNSFWSSLQVLGVVGWSVALADPAGYRAGRLHRPALAGALLMDAHAAVRRARVRLRQRLDASAGEYSTMILRFDVRNSARHFLLRRAVADRAPPRHHAASLRADSRQPAAAHGRDARRFLLVIDGRWQNAVAALIGFTAARLILV